MNSTKRRFDLTAVIVIVAVIIIGLIHGPITTAFGWLILSFTLELIAGISWFILGRIIK